MILISEQLYSKSKNKIMMIKMIISII